MPPLSATGAKGAGYCAEFNHNAGGHIANSLFLNKLNGISLEATSHTNDSFSQWTSGNLSVSNNLFHQVATGNPGALFSLSGFYTPAELQQWSTSFTSSGNLIADPIIDYPHENSVQPAEKIRGTLTPLPHPWFQVVDFKGAFGESDWISGWTKLSSLAE